MIIKSSEKVLIFFHLLFRDKRTDRRMDGQNR